MGHRLGLATRTQISVCKSPFPSAGTTESLFRAKTVQQRPLLPREDETRLPDCGVTHTLSSVYSKQLNRNEAIKELTDLGNQCQS